VTTSGAGGSASGPRAVSRTWFDDRVGRGAVLAPMANYSDAPFRRLARHFGAAWAVSEMISAKALALAPEAALDERISAPYPGEPYAVLQLFAAEPETAASAVARLGRRFRPAAFDLNLGCPVRKVVNRGCGSELLRRPERAAAILAAMVAAAEVPVSAKLRLGIEDDVAVEVAQALVRAGASALAVHGRTARQGYRGRADWDAIARVAAAVDVPVVGSGDVDDAARWAHARGRGLGVMVGRGAIGRPWLFAELRGEAPPCRAGMVAVLWRHALDHAAWHGGPRPLRSLRGQLAAYARALAAAAGPPLDAVALRGALVQVDTPAELAQALTRHGIEPRWAFERLGGTWPGLLEAAPLAPARHGRGRHGRGRHGRARHGRGRAAPGASADCG
jgi:tRNA-dihydrouridine synthase B